MKFAKAQALVLFIALVSACGNVETKPGFFKVTRVVDGDTFVIDDGSEKGEKVRLIGVNAPESRKSGKKDVEYFGKEAKKFLKNYLDGKSVRLEYDVSHNDKYGRTLAYVYMEDGTFLNEYLLKEGYAQVMTIQPNVKYADHFINLQHEARENGKGLWAEE